MDYDRLLAKSPRKKEDAPQLTLREHTEFVIKAAITLVETTGADQLLAIGLDPDRFLDQFRKDILIASLLHDLGKANDHFQGMIQKIRHRDQPQGLRHEAVSFLLARDRVFRDWYGGTVQNDSTIELILWSVAGHHRKFPRFSAPEGSGSKMKIYLDHRDFINTLKLGSEMIDLPDPPIEALKNHRFKLVKLTSLDSKGIFNELKDARKEASNLWNSLDDSKKRYLAVLKACLICADVAGSIARIESGSSESPKFSPINDWIPNAFKRIPSSEQLKMIADSRIGTKQSPSSQTYFQNRVADSPDRVTFVKAGCGTGKTIAAYKWAERQAKGKRLFFCYPTTGTATEGYRDYLKIDDLGADLVHSRSATDKEIFDLHQSDVPQDAEPIGRNGDDEHDRDENFASGGRLLASEDAMKSIEIWSKPIVSCTVDTVLGITQNNRQGIYAWPSIARSAIVFDEIHSYDNHLFEALVRFLQELPGIPCLLMTASLPDIRLERLRSALNERQKLEPIEGPRDLEHLKRYQRFHCDDEEAIWSEVDSAYRAGQKILWVVNTVEDAMRIADSDRAKELNAIVYHSRFKYKDRVVRHQAVIEMFKQENSPVLAITTQVAEQSLDLSADLLVSSLAPIPSLIQRLGRLNRRAKIDGSSGVKRFIVYRFDPSKTLPYTAEMLNDAEAWLKELGDGPLSQADLVDPEKWKQNDRDLESFDSHECIWLDGGFTTEARPLREASIGVEIILQEDYDQILLEKENNTKSFLPEEVRIPMPPPPSSLGSSDWDEYQFCLVPPNDRVSYDPERGARWITN